MAITIGNLEIVLIHYFTFSFKNLNSHS